MSPVPPVSAMPSLAQGSPARPADSVVPYASAVSSPIDGLLARAADSVAASLPAVPSSARGSPADSYLLFMPLPTSRSVKQH